MATQAIAAKDSYLGILTAEAAGVFQVVGYEKQTKSAEVINTTPLVQAFYDQGSFSKQSAAITSAKQHDTTIRIVITVAEDARTDIATLNNPASDDAARAAALAGTVIAAQRASDSLETVWSKVWEITNDARNADLGLASGIVANTWLDQFQRDEPAEQGGYVIITASAQLTFRIEEPVLGDPGTTSDPTVYKSDLSITADPDGTADPVEESGVRVNVSP